MKRLSILFFIVFFIGTQNIFAASKIAEAVKQNDGQAPQVEKKKPGDTTIISEDALPKTLKGTVSYAEGNYLTIVYNRNDKTGEEFEMGFTLDPDVQFSRAKNLSDLAIGSTVEVQFDEVQQVCDEVQQDGSTARKTKVENRKIKGVTFLSPPKSDLSSQ